MYFDNKLNFDYHIDKLCKKASQKLHALARVSVFMSSRQKKQIMNAFITPQFGYCQLIWMFQNIPHSTKYCLNTISHLAPKIWEIIPNEIKSCKSLNSFKTKINMWVPTNCHRTYVGPMCTMWVPTNCPCNLCRPYVHNVGTNKLPIQPM